MRSPLLSGALKDDAARFWVVRTLELCSASARGASAPGESAPGTEASGTAAPGAAAPARVPLAAGASTAAEPHWDQHVMAPSGFFVPRTDAVRGGSGLVLGRHRRRPPLRTYPVPDEERAEPAAAIDPDAIFRGRRSNSGPSA